MYFQILTKQEYSKKLPPDFLYAEDYYNNLKYLEDLYKDYGYYIPEKFYPVGYVEELLFNKVNCTVGYVRKKSEGFNSETICLREKNRYNDGFYIITYDCYYDSNTDKYYFDYDERSRIVKIELENIPLYRLLLFNNVFAQ